MKYNLILLLLTFSNLSLHAEKREKCDTIYRLSKICVEQPDKFTEDELDKAIACFETNFGKWCIEQINKECEKCSKKSDDDDNRKNYSGYHD